MTACSSPKLGLLLCTHLSLNELYIFSQKHISCKENGMPTLHKRLQLLLEVLFFYTYLFHVAGYYLQS